MRIHYLPEFWEDVRIASDWLAEERRELGPQFVAAVLAAVNQVGSLPGTYRIIAGNTRRYIIRRFRYLLFYDFDGDSVTILGVVHGSRDVSQWLERRRED